MIVTAMTRTAPSQQPIPVAIKRRTKTSKVLICYVLLYIKAEIIKTVEARQHAAPAAMTKYVKMFMVSPQISS